MKSAFVIGYKNHAKKIIDILKKKKIQISIYHDDIKKTQIKDFYEVVNYDYVFILSPNHTHYYYLSLLEKINYKKSIFCEKPLINSKNQLNQLNKFKIKNRIFTNFGIVDSDFFKIIKKYSNKKNIGQLLITDLISSHSFGFSNNYLKNWRSDKQTNKNGVLETVSIHFIYFFYKLFGKFDSISHIKKKIIKKSSSIDFAQTNIITKKNSSIINITTSYVSPLIFKITMLFSKGIITVDNQNIKIYTISLKKDKFNRSVSPVLLFEKKIDIKSIWNESHKNNINIFLKNKSNFKKNFNDSIYIHNKLFK